jgi:2-polyprenyl-3-methyl-5-hydroxy-6-metoxy-1,4-benzoquinol methylase
LLDLLGPLSGGVLDVGCGVGAWADELRAAGAQRLTGIEPAEAAADRARTRYDIVRAEPIELLELDALGGEPFAHVIAADVLEHLVDPWRVLRALHGWSLPAATLAISVPNARNFRLSLALVLGGRFTYRTSGLMDWTHLRWFTRASLEDALRLSGWEPQRWRWVTAGKSRLLGSATRGASDPFLAPQIQVVARRA